MDENIETKERFFEKHKLEWELRQREEEIAELQKALSDMQVYLFQERDHVLRLFAENDRLKIQELEDRKRCVGLSDEDVLSLDDRSKIHSLNEKLHRTQQMLYDSTKDYLELKYEGRSQERVWMAEKDRLLQELDRCKEQLDVSKDDVLVISDHALEERQTQNLEIEDKTEKLAKRLHLMNQRYEAMEKRRNLEIEGFKNDTRILRNQLKDVEKQLYKVTVGVGEDGDMFMLHNIHQTAKRSKKMQSELLQLKALIYGVETDLRNL
ncbi:coiled-coil domain-containing protein 77-like [Patiria miniata]|uniref:Coiled-coil domain-containing protein 77 n=1 Tax=Patiria miniata TaxID=46514 RepID=A0A913Z942_PATMI|nr:coiled-coil domain-containing protein 77-like [Patiria miniata]